MRALLAAVRCVKGDLEGNLAAHLRLLAAAASAGCDIALFPEMSLTGSVDPVSRPDRLARLDDPVVATLAAASGETGVGICFGVAERSATGRPHITQIVAADGCVTGVQRKRHLGEGEDAFVAGTDSCVFRCAGTTFGIAICAEAGHDGPFDS